MRAVGPRRPRPLSRPRRGAGLRLPVFYILPHNTPRLLGQAWAVKLVNIKGFYVIKDTLNKRNGRRCSLTWRCRKPGQMEV